MPTASTTDRLSQARETLGSVGQGHVLSFVDQLDEAATERLLSEVEAIDWNRLAKLIESHVKHKPEFKLPESIEPVPTYPSTPTAELKDKYKKSRELGEQLIREGKVAAFTVAGGQGTRLGWPGPKGAYPATPIRKLPLFACMAEYLRKVEKKYGTACRWYIMTSPANDADTRAFFKDHGYLGLAPDQVVFFPQGMLPAIDTTTGKVLMASQSGLALSPNGHGGSLQALYASGAIDDMKQRGIEQISYTQVDNPLVKVIDPVFIGLHAMDNCGMSSKMLPKAFPKEKLGNFCLVDGRVTVIEYSDLPDELTEQRLDNGQLRFNAGSIAIHMMRVDFVESLNTAPGGFALPYHRAEKKVTCLDTTTGKLIEPQSPNAVKLETFVFDALPLCERSIVYETQREEEFAPIKNATGVDSPETSAQLQTQRAAKWLERCGVAVPRDEQGDPQAVIEISQLKAIEPDDLSGNGASLPASIEAGTEVLL